MRVERAIDAFLDWRRLERDATPRSVDSYWRILVKLAEEYPEARLESLTTERPPPLPQKVARNECVDSFERHLCPPFVLFMGGGGGSHRRQIRRARSAGHRNESRTSIAQASMSWSRVRRAALAHERPAILLMEGAGLRRSEVLGCRWADLGLVRGRARVHRKGLHWHWLPLDRMWWWDSVESFRSLQPELDDHVFTVEVEQWVSQYERVRGSKDPKAPASDTGADANGLASVQASRCSSSSRLISFGTASRTGSCVRAAATSPRCRPDSVTRASTRRSYTRRTSSSTSSRTRCESAHNARDAQASPDLATLETEVASGLETLEWRRRESNPRPSSHRSERLQA